MINYNIKRNLKKYIFAMITTSNRIWKLQMHNAFSESKDISLKQRWKNFCWLVDNR